MKLICVDFDGVIHDNMNYRGSRVINGKPIPGTIEALNILSCDYEVVIHSARCQDVEAMKSIEEWLHKYNMNYELVRFKPNAYIFIDDRGINFSGNWEKTLDDVKIFTQWQEKTKNRVKSIRKGYVQLKK